MSLASAIRLALEARKDPASISPCRGEASAQVALLPVTDRRDEQVKTGSPRAAAVSRVVHLRTVPEDLSTPGKFVHLASGCRGRA